MNIQQTAIQEINECLAQMITAWMIIINVDVEIFFTYEEDEPNPRTSQITGYSCELVHHARFGTCWLNEDGRIDVKRDEVRGLSATISTYVSVELPHEIMKVIRKHLSLALFDAHLDYINLNCKVYLPDVEEFSVMLLLGGVISELQLMAFDETLVRSNAQWLLHDLQKFLPWFEYAAGLADPMEDELRRADLIADMRLVLAHIDRGADLPFAKLTSLCDVAGSLQPIRNLIHKNIPSLVV